MKLSDRIERTERGTILNLAHERSADFERSFDTSGHSAKDVFKAKQYGAKFIRENNVVEISLPYLPASQYFVDLLNMKKADYDYDYDPYRYYDEDDDKHDHHDDHDDFHCRVVLIIPAGVDKESVDRSLFDEFNAISSVTCEIRQAVVTYQAVSVDELGTAHRAGFAP